MRANRLTLAFALPGLFLVALPLIAPFFFSVIALITRGLWLFDYLMPAELFFLALPGGGLLLLAAFRAGAERALIGGSLATAIVMFFGSQALAVITGLASGEIEPTGWPWALVLGGLGLYALALALLVAGGTRLTRRLLRPAP